jgi:hypothetical protein
MILASVVVVKNTSIVAEFSANHFLELYVFASLL